MKIKEPGTGLCLEDIKSNNFKISYFLIINNIFICSDCRISTTVESQIALIPKFSV